MTDPREAALGLHRFGFGPGPVRSRRRIRSAGGAARRARQAKRWQDLRRGLTSSGAASRSTSEFLAERAAKQKLEKKRKEAAKSPPVIRYAKAGSENSGADTAGAKPAEQRPIAPARRKPVPMRAKSFSMRPRPGIAPPYGPRSELSSGWSGSGRTIFASPPTDDRARRGAFEREAIRPNVRGRFADMLLAAESHPAMLNYLDNAQSMGPNSVAGVNRVRHQRESRRVRFSNCIPSGFAPDIRRRTSPVSPR